jgi:hypothetical protein
VLDKLKNRWKVNGLQLTLILLTFALGGSCCGYLARRVLVWIDLEAGMLKGLLYLLLVTLLWPLCVILVSIPFGQFAFFKNYLRKIYNRISNKKAQ